MRHVDLHSVLRGTALLTRSRSASSDGPPAAAIASAMMLAGGKVYTPGVWTAPATSTRSGPGVGLGNGVA